MLESTKEDATGLPEGSDIGLGAGCREFESPHSDHLSQKNRLFWRFFCVFVLFLCLGRLLFSGDSRRSEAVGT